MPDHDYNFARLVFQMELHHDQSDDQVRYGSPDLNNSHKRILNFLSHQTWTPRNDLLQKTEFRPKPLKKHLKFLMEHDYIEERKNPEERRQKEYRRV